MSGRRALRCSTRLSVQTGRVERPSPRVSDGRLAARLRLEKAPCTGIEPVSPDRQSGRHASCVTGPVHRLRLRVRAAAPQSRRFRASAKPQAALTARTEGFEPSPPALETDCSPRSTFLSSTFLSSCPGRARTYSLPVNSGLHHRCATGQYSPAARRSQASPGRQRCRRASRGI
jgi:hypothetical protein